MRVEVQNTTRVIDLTLEDYGTFMKFTGGPDDGPLTQGSMIRITATSSHNQTASSGWFPYMNATPAVDCTSQQQPDASTKDAGVDAVTKDASDAGSDVSTKDASIDVSDAMTSDVSDAAVKDTGGNGGCVPSWNPSWQQSGYSGAWWVEYAVRGGSVPVSVTLEVVGGSTYALTQGVVTWSSGLDGVSSGTTVIVHARDATGATAQTVPFPYLVNPSPATDPCKTTPSTSQSCVPLARGMLSITMDDSYPSQETLAAPLLAKYGMKATVYNITRQLDLYGVLPYAKQLASQGHETGSHTVNHNDLTSLSLADVDYELGASQSYLVANVGSPVDSFATPMGSYNASVLTEIKKYYTSHRTVNPGLSYTGTDVFQLNADSVINANSPTDVCASLQEAATYRGWRILLFHDFTTDSTSSFELTYPIADFESILKCAQATSGLDVVTVHDGANTIRCASH
jgi:peptidoglycan/xylan/chitin deacetylase (PgdA/CDA1 family)